MLGWMSRSVSLPDAAGDAHSVRRYPRSERQCLFPRLSGKEKLRLVLFVKTLFYVRAVTLTVIVAFLVLAKKRVLAAFLHR